MIIIPIKEGENLERALKKFKIKFAMKLNKQMAKKNSLRINGPAKVAVVA